MASKHNQYSTPAMKVLGLYGLLLFTGRTYSLQQLAATFSCSKQTILRMMEQIERTRGIRVEATMREGRKWFRVPTPPRAPNVSLDVESIQHLLLCRDIVWHLLPEGLRDEIGQTIAHAAVLLPEYEDRAQALQTFARAQVKGAIDYSEFQGIIEKLFDALRRRRICEVWYRSPARNKTRLHRVAPLRILSFREGLYVKCRLEAALANPEGYYDPTFAIHRLLKVTVTDQPFDMPELDDPEVPDTFGFMPGEPFRARVRVRPGAAGYVRERQWSADQSIDDLTDGGLILEFTATSRPEVIAWVLGFGPQAELLAPADLRRETREALRATLAAYEAGPAVEVHAG